MTVTDASVEYQVRIATPGATVVEGNVALTLTLDDMTAAPILSGPTVDVLRTTAVSSPFRVDCIVDDVLFASSGRLTELGRLAEVRTNTDGAGFVTRGTGRISYASEVDGRGRVTIEITDERWVERRTTVFHTTETIQLHPPGLAVPWRDRPAAGTATYLVQQVDGDYMRIRPGDEESAGLRHVPMSLCDALAGDLKPSGEWDRDLGNFVSLRFRWANNDYEVVAFGLSRAASKSAGDGPGGLLDQLSPGGAGVLQNAWILAPSHGQTVGNELTARFYFSAGVEVAENVPLHIGGVDGLHPGALLRALYDGDYGGQPVRYDEASMATIEALPLLPVWANVRASADRASWLEKNIYPAFGILPLVGTDLVLRPTPLHLPQGVDPESLAVLDATNAGLPTWSHTSREMATVLVFRTKAARPIGDTTNRGRSWPADDLDLVDARAPEESHDNVALLGEVTHTIDTDLVLKFPGASSALLARGLFDVVGDGAQMGTVDVPYDADVEVGDLVLLDQDTFKGYNAETAARTGDRLVRLISFRGVNAATTEFSYLDLGPNAQPLAAPTVAIDQSSDDLDVVLVTISDLPSGATAEVQVTVDSTEPDMYSQVQTGVGEETVAFLVGAAAGNAYVRARSTAPHRVRSLWATDSVALVERPKILSARIEKVGGLAFFYWTLSADTGAVRANWAIHARNEEPVLGSNIDYNVATFPDGNAVPDVKPGDVVTLQLTPYETYSGGASGLAGEPIILTAIFPKVTGGYEIARPEVSIVSQRARSIDPIGGSQAWERDIVIVPSAFCYSVVISYSFIRPHKTVDQPPPSTTFEREYTLDVTPLEPIEHTLMDGGTDAQAFIAQDNAGTTLRDSSFFIQITPYARPGGATGGGGAGETIGYGVNQIGSDNDVGVRVKTVAGQDIPGLRIATTPGLDFGFGSDGEVRIGHAKDVTLFGADFTGATSASDAIQATLDAVSPGDTMVFPVGTYAMDAVVGLSSVADLTIDFGISTILTDDATLDGLFAFTSCDRLTIRGGYFVCDETHAAFAADTPAEIRPFIRLTTCDNATLSGMVGVEKRAFIQATSCEFLSIRDVKFSGFFQALTSGVQSNANTALTVNLVSCNYATVNGVTAHNHGSAVLVQGSGSYSAVANVTGRDLHDNGVYVSSGNGWSISNCSFRYVGGDGVQTRGPNMTVQNISVTSAGDAAVAMSGVGATPDAEGANGHNLVATGIVGVDCEVGFNVIPVQGLYARDIILADFAFYDCNGTGESNCPVRIQAIKGVMVHDGIIRTAAADIGVTIVGPGSGTDVEGVHIHDVRVEDINGSSASSRGGVRVQDGENILVHSCVFSDIDSGIGVRILRGTNGMIYNNIYEGGNVVRIPTGESNTGFYVHGNRGNTIVVDTANNYVRDDYLGTNITAETGITASTTQSQGQQPLTAIYSVVSTVANANDVVTLPVAGIGRGCEVVNAGANTLQIFPASGDAIDGGSVNASTTLAAGSTARFRSHDSTNWYS